MVEIEEYTYYKEKASNSYNFVNEGGMVIKKPNLDDGNLHSFAFSISHI